MARVTLVVRDAAPRVVDVRPGATLLRAAVRARMPIGRSCRGVGVCAACRIVIVEGGVAAMDPLEAHLAARAPLATHERYACCARVIGDVTVTTSYW